MIRLIHACFLVGVPLAAVCHCRAEEQKPQTVLLENKTGILGVRFTPDGKSLIFSSEDGTLRFWDVAACKELRTIPGVESSWALTADAKTLSIGTRDGLIKVLDTSTGKLRQQLKGHNKAVIALSFSADGSTMASMSAEGVRITWDTAKWQRANMPFVTKPIIAFSMALSPDGKFLAASDVDSGLSLWEINAKKKPATALTRAAMPALIDMALAHAVTYSPDGKRLATSTRLADNLGLPTGRSQVKLFSVPDLKELASFAGPESWTTALAFSPDGKMLACGWQDGSAKLLDAALAKEIASLKGHNDPILSLAFSPDGKHLASSAGEFDVEQGKYTRGRLLLWQLPGTR